jgi:hypothetical protein
MQLTWSNYTALHKEQEPVAKKVDKAHKGGIGHHGRGKRITV